MLQSLEFAETQKVIELSQVLKSVADAGSLCAAS